MRQHNFITIGTVRLAEYIENLKHLTVQSAIIVWKATIIIVPCSTIALANVI